MVVRLLTLCPEINQDLLLEVLQPFHRDQRQDRKMRARLISERVARLPECCRRGFNVLGRVAVDLDQHVYKWLGPIFRCLLHNHAKVSTCEFNVNFLFRMRLVLPHHGHDWEAEEARLTLDDGILRGVDLFYEQHLLEEERRLHQAQVAELEAEIQAFQRVFDAQNQELQHVQQEAENEVAEHEVAVEALQAQIDQYEWMQEQNDPQFEIEEELPGENEVPQPARQEEQQLPEVRCAVCHRLGRHRPCEHCQRPTCDGCRVPDPGENIRECYFCSHNLSR